MEAAESLFMEEGEFPSEAGIIRSVT